LSKSTPAPQQPTVTTPQTTPQPVVHQQPVSTPKTTPRPVLEEPPPPPPEDDEPPPPPPELEMENDELEDLPPPPPFREPQAFQLVMPQIQPKVQPPKPQQQVPQITVQPPQQQYRPVEEEKEEIPDIPLPPPPMVEQRIAKPKPIVKVEEPVEVDLQANQGALFEALQKTKLKTVQNNAPPP